MAGVLAFLPALSISNPTGIRKMGFCHAGGFRRPSSLSQVLRLAKPGLPSRFHNWKPARFMTIRTMRLIPANGVHTVRDEALSATQILPR